jgi:transposase
VNSAEQVVLRKKLRRSQMVAYFEKLPQTVIGIEASAGPITGLGCWHRLGTR